METVYFISDVHLGAHSAEAEHLKLSRLLTFLKSIAAQANHIYIVGDLYDFWFEYFRVIPKIDLRLLVALARLIDDGIRVTYLTGNHDLWQEAYLCDQIGITVRHEPVQVVHNNLKLFVAHGDGLTAGQWKMRFMKRILKNRTNIFLYRLIHPDLGIPIARFFSHRSKKKGENKHISEFEMFAKGKLADGFDAVILGHTHRPHIENVRGGYYVNLGDWVKSFTYLELAGRKFSLKSFHD